MKKYIAILEDDPDRLTKMRAFLAQLLPQFEHVYFDDAVLMIAWLADHLWEVVLISLDHDLPSDPDHSASDHGTGRQVADYLSAQPAVCPVIVHTSNEFFAPGMLRVLLDGGWPVRRVYPHSDLDWVNDGWAQQIRKFVIDGWIFD